jgi:hypothetical protein
LAILLKNTLALGGSFGMFFLGVKGASKIERWGGLDCSTNQHESKFAIFNSNFHVVRCFHPRSSSFAEWSHVRPRPPPTHIIFPARFHKGPVLVLAYLPYHLFSLGGSYALTFSCGPEHKTPVHFFQPAAPRARARVLSTQFGVLTAASKPHLFT